MTIGMKRLAVRRMFVLLAGAGILSATSCTRGADDPPDDPGPGTTTYLGALPEPADSMSVDDFRAFVETLRDSAGGGEEGQRECTGRPGCIATPPTEFATVFIGAVADAQTVPLDHAHADGIIVAWFDHRAGPAARQYGFLPMHQYYVVLFPGSEYRLRQVNPGGVHQWHGDLRPYRVCEPRHTPGAAEAGWRECTPEAVVRAAAGGVGAHPHFILTSGGAGVQRDVTMGWISCVYGCCYPDPVLN